MPHKKHDCEARKYNKKANTLYGGPQNCQAPKPQDVKLITLQVVDQRLFRHGIWSPEHHHM